MSVAGTLRIVQGVLLVAGGVLAALGTTGAAFSSVSAADVGLTAFAGGLLAAAGAEYVSGRTGRAALSVVAAVLFGVVAVGPAEVATASGILLLVVGLVLMADSLTDGRLRERFSA